MLVTELGIVMEAKDVQFIKALIPINFRVLGKEIAFKEEQP